MTKYTSLDQIKAADLDAHYAVHDSALFYHNATEEKARATYQWLSDLSDDPDMNDSLAFLRA